MSDKILDITQSIVGAYVSNNPVPMNALPDLIADVAESIRKISGTYLEESPKPTPAINPKRTVFDDYIICLEDGKKFKSMKRHLMIHHGLTPEQYRQKWNLPADYPMVAPSYAAERSQLAKAMGLGSKKLSEPEAKSGRTRGRAKAA